LPGEQSPEKARRRHTEDADCDGLWDWNNQTFTGETCSWKFDSDGDGLGDGMEVGKTLCNITSDTNTSIFIQDADPTTTTNPLAIDSDGDGVPDVLENFFSTLINDWDTDGDGIGNTLAKAACKP
jgi:hypothetical protein